jgi:hypothetical protein
MQLQDSQRQHPAAAAAAQGYPHPEQLLLLGRFSPRVASLAATAAAVVAALHRRQHHLSQCWASKLHAWVAAAARRCR